jgi:hypothetical protein
MTERVEIAFGPSRAFRTIPDAIGFTHRVQRVLDLGAAGSGRVVRGARMSRWDTLRLTLDAGLNVVLQARIAEPFDRVEVCLERRPALACHGVEGPSPVVMLDSANLSWLWDRGKLLERLVGEPIDRFLVVAENSCVYFAARLLVRVSPARVAGSVLPLLYWDWAD